MPEGLEAELYRRSAHNTVGRVVESVCVDDIQPQALEIRAELPGRQILGTGRLGKQVWISFGRPGERATVGPTDRMDSSWDRPVASEVLRLGLHFGMAGRLLVDGRAAIDSLAYSSARWNPDWNRLEVEFTPDSGGGSLIVNDPRRWSRFTLDPDLSRLGPDLFAVSPGELYRRLHRRRAPIKAALLDQSVVAGLGNMLVDELLAWAGIAPQRPANELEPGEVDRLIAAAHSRLPVMLNGGGSHSGLLNPDRRRDLGPCPFPDCQSPAIGASLARDRVGGRTTVWCQDHQR